MAKFIWQSILLSGLLAITVFIFQLRYHIVPWTPSESLLEFAVFAGGLSFLFSMGVHFFAFIIFSWRRPGAPLTYSGLSRELERLLKKIGETSGRTFLIGLAVVLFAALALAVLDALR